MSAAGTTITNILGLVCDPIAGLVEAPCQKRNAMGASNAIVAAQITLAGVGNLLPLDEVIDVMYSVATRAIPFELRETALERVWLVLPPAAVFPSRSSADPHRIIKGERTVSLVLFSRTEDFHV